MVGAVHTAAHIVMHATFSSSGLHMLTVQPLLECRLQQLLSVTAQGLAQRGASNEVHQFVEQVLQRQHKEYTNYMATEADKRRRLLEHVRHLEVRTSLLASAMCWLLI